MNWLERIQDPKFYRYMFYKSYQVGIKLKTDDPPLAAEYNMFVTLLFQFGFLIGLVSIIIGKNIWLEYITRRGKLEIGIFIVAFLSIIYLLFLYKKKWQRIVQEFEGENKEDSKKGFLYLLVYFLGSIGLFVMGIWFLTFNNPNYV